MNLALLTKQYDINRWFRNFGARPTKLFGNPLNDVKFRLGALEYRATYHNGAGITFHSKLLSSPLLVRTPQLARGTTWCSRVDRRLRLLTAP